MNQKPEKMDDVSQWWHHEIPSFFSGKLGSHEASGAQMLEIKLVFLA